MGDALCTALAAHSQLHAGTRWELRGSPYPPLPGGFGSSGFPARFLEGILSGFYAMLNP